MTDITIREFNDDDLLVHLEALADILQACVNDGASVNFIHPFGPAEARVFWIDKVWPALRAGSRRLLVAERDDRLVGTVQLDTAMPPNQTHRCEVTKLLVHPGARRQGAGRLLMIELERLAMEMQRSLITLDTTTGEKAEPLYASLGFQTTGVVPGFSLSVDGKSLEATSYMYKIL